MKNWQMILTISLFLMVALSPYFAVATDSKVTVLTKQISEDKSIENPTGIPANQWRVFTSDGKGAYFVSRKLRKQRSLTENLEENILEIHPDLAWVKTHPTAKMIYHKPDFQSILIGKWYSYEVWDVNDISNKTYNIVLKVPPDEFRLIYSLQPIDSTVSPKAQNTMIIQTQNRAELLKKIEVFKSERYEHHISFDKDKKNLNIK